MATRHSVQMLVLTATEVNAFDIMFMLLTVLFLAVLTTCMLRVVSQLQ